ncbi:O-antigen ligase family protein [Aneurinibacillus sp. Ricciae_BoGa-3]|uniref:O-antigen ligase family protein n=1 Tax=Aneurinibacillus sp. Ricciae_BoGa-3 TaxID=3022697 RepID=UPI00234273A2|nr:O-antigen ligase family protein [Aneurinibacillus sp. Ricciae_BoGa-3]WCK52706.1 O-antigen ligase family protein [Aneurinibacillus sp. Ricciae_BoGa-3]
MSITKLSEKKIENFQLFKWGLILLFFLPPIGIGLLFIAGWIHLFKVIRGRAAFHATAGTFFFVSIFVASIGATLAFHQLKYLGAPLMTAAYLGLYLYARENCKLTSLAQYKKLLIIGSCYLVVMGQFQILGIALPGQDSVFGFLTGYELLGYFKDGRLFGSAYNPNFAAFLLLLTSAVVLSGLLKRPESDGRRRTILHITVMLLLAAALFETGSRTGLAGLMVLLVIFCFRIRRKYGLVSLGAFAVFGYQLMSILPRTHDMGESVQTRKFIWEASVNIWRQHPLFGVTPIGFKDAYAGIAGDGITHAHNVLLGFFSEYGTLGGLSFLVLLVSCGYRMIRLYTAVKNRKQVFDLFLLALPVFLITGIFDHPLVSPQAALPAIILLGSWDAYSERVKFLARAAVPVKQISA